MKFFLPFIIGSFFLVSGQAQYDYIFEDLSGDDLFNALRGDYKPGLVLPYDNARDILFGTIDKKNDSLECIYSGYKVYLPPGQDPTTAACEGDGCPGINTEHVYPQSLWNGGNNPRADMHHLFPTKAAVNGARASFPFADINDASTDTWYFEDQETGNIPTSNIDMYSESVNGFFEPRESVKGDIARAMFYFYTMYRNEANGEDPNFFNNQVNTLCEWHNNDPVDYDEAERTWEIAEYQQGKPNPFVLDCTLASRIYCSDIGWYCNYVVGVKDDFLSEIQFKISPNPTREYVQLEWDEQATSTEELEVTFYDMLGNELKKVKSQSGQIWDVSEFPNGMLMVKIQSRRQIATKKFMKM